MSLPFHLKEIFEKEVNFSNKFYSIFMFNADYQWDDSKKKNKNYIFFLIAKNYDFGGENMIMVFFFRINQLPVVYSQENEEAT